jgi:hypothetical protein
MLLGSSFQTLPWERAIKEVHQDIGQQFEIISAGFLYAQEGVERRISGSALKILVLPVGDVEVVAAHKKLSGLMSR